MVHFQFYTNSVVRNPGYVLVLAFCCFMPTVGFSEKTEGLPLNGISALDLVSKVDLNKNTIQLRDLLSVSPDDSSLADATIGVAPTLGKEITIRRSDLESLLHRLLPKARWTLTGADQCVIARPAVEINETRTKDLIEEALHKFTNKEGQIGVVQLINFSSLLVPKQRVDVEVELIAPNAKTRFGSALIAIDVQGRPFLRHNVRFEWEWKRTVWVARETQPTGMIQANGFTGETRNILTLPDEPLISESLPSNLILNRSMGKGEPLLRSNLKIPIAVSRGSAVSACVVTGALQISMKAIALENGSVGQTIRVQNPTSGKELFGKVTHENIVQVIP